MSQANISNIIPQSEMEDDMLQWCSKTSDVVFIIDGHRLPTQRSTLSNKSEYFRDLLLGTVPESKLNEIKLNAPLEQFKMLLVYIYSGSLPSLNLDERIKMLALATEYIVPDLILEITEQLVMNLNLENVAQILNAAQFYTADKLWQAALDFVDSEAKEFLEHKSFKNLPSHTLQQIIQRDSFSSPELAILQAVLAWRNKNPNEDFEPILRKIRFTLMSTNELLTVVKAMDLFIPEKLNDIVSEQQNLRNRPFRYVTLPDTNISTTDFNARYIQNGHSYQYIPTYLSCAIGTEAIVIELGGIFVLNNIEFCLNCMYYEACSYYIESSLDQRNWDRIIDYSKFLCHSWQNLYFKSRPIRFLRFVGTRNTAEEEFQIKYIKTMYSNKMPEIVNDVCVPTEKLEDCSYYIKMEKDSDDDVDSDNPTFIDNSIRLALQQPYFIGSMRIVFSNEIDPICSYFVETSVDNENWIKAVNLVKGSTGILKFKPRPVIFVRVKFMGDEQYSTEMCVELPAFIGNAEEEGDVEHLL